MEHIVVINSVRPCVMHLFAMTGAFVCFCSIGRLKKSGEGGEERQKSAMASNAHGPQECT